MASVGRIQALCWSAVAVALFCAAPALADDAGTEDAGVFEAWDTMPEDELGDHRAGDEIEVESDGNLSLNIGITDGSITNSSADNAITGHIFSNPITSNTGINMIDMNTGPNVIIQKNANLNIHMY